MIYLQEGLDGGIQNLLNKTFGPYLWFAKWNITLIQ